MSIVRLRITLANVTPPVTRIVEVPHDIILARLHLVIQAAMPWQNYHLYEYQTKTQRWGQPMQGFILPGMPSSRNASRETLADLMAAQKQKSFLYVYDFGDDWVHNIKIEKLVEPQDGAAYPRLVEAEGRCPPEDVGGPWGYAELVEALADPEHDRHDEIVEWVGEDYDPTAFDKPARVKAVAKLAKPAKGKSPRSKANRA